MGCRSLARECRRPRRTEAAVDGGAFKNVLVYVEDNVHTLRCKLGALSFLAAVGVTRGGGRCSVI